MTSATIKPIRSEADYQVALQRIAVLMDAEEDSPEADELEVLAMYEQYEEKHFPIDLPDPNAAIHLWLEQAGNSINE